jgi:phospholipid/cholesterol/gamma-HCH transport system ATP-binding protein
LILAIQQEYNTASLIITHDMDCARVISNRMVILVDGMDYGMGTYQELATSKDPKIQAFFK